MFVILYNIVTVFVTLDFNEYLDTTIAEYDFENNCVVLNYLYG